MGIKFKALGKMEIYMEVVNTHFLMEIFTRDNSSTAKLIIRASISQDNLN